MKSKDMQTHIGDYEILRILGKGGMGTVYLCKDHLFDRPVAIKVLNRKSGQESDTVRKMRFIREAMITAQLQHPGIPPVYAISPAESKDSYFVMKPIEGHSLQEILDALRNNESGIADQYDLYRLVEIFRQVCQTLRYAHSKGFLHRDIKPSNIFAGAWGGVYVIDWGLAKSIKATKAGEEVRSADREDGPNKVESSTETGEFGMVSATDETVAHNYSSGSSFKSFELGSIPFNSRVDLTMDGDVLGTIAYMPPEQAEGSIDELGRQADIYALGVILYEILTHELPVSGRTLQDVVDQKSSGEIEPPELRAPQKDVPPELSAITMQAMAPSPDERFGSVAELDRACTFWLEGKSQFRLAHKPVIDQNDLRALPARQLKAWGIKGNRIQTLPLHEKRLTYLLFRHSFEGELRINMNVTAWPLDEEENISGFAIVFNATVPQPYRGHLDAYILHFGANKNTRVYLTRNDTEVASSRYVALEPGVQYRLTITRTDREIRVLLNRQLIINYRDRDPLGGQRCGFLHQGEGVHLSRVRIHTRGQATRVSSIDIPEALMEEQCYPGAERHFMAIARAHANRFEGAWARYRAGMAAYLQSKDRQRAYRLWMPLRRGPFAVFEQLGRASLELEEGRVLKAAHIIREMLAESENIPHLDTVADIVFNQTQLLLRQEQTGIQHWKKLDAWARLALIIGTRVDSKKEITPSLLWRWILMALTEYPDQLEECIRFMRETFGKGRGSFGEILTTIDPLMTILKRSAAMTDHAYLMNKVMRLILNYDDNLGDLQTLARFYLHSGHEAMAEMISHHIFHFCQKNRYAIPPMPITLLAVLSWLRGERARSLEFFQSMLQTSYDFATLDAHLLLGLYALEQNDRKTATQHWQLIAGKSSAVESNRHLVAQGLLGLLPPDAKEAGVPKRSDHQLLYSLFLGWKYYLEWKHNGDFATRQRAVGLLTTVVELQRPSYDVYSSTDTFARIPLEVMGYQLPSRKRPEELSVAERKWVSELTMAASRKEDENSEPEILKTRKANQLLKESAVEKKPIKS